MISAKYAFILCALMLLQFQICPAAVPDREPATDTFLTQQWKRDYRRVRGAIADKNRAGKHEPCEGCSDVAANHQANIWDSDRTPCDVAARRLRALIDRLRTLPEAPDLDEYDSELAKILQRLSPSHSPSIDQDWSDYLALRRIGRRVALSNPLLNFDGVIFNRWTSTYGHVQEAFGSTVRPEGGLYVLTGLRSGTPHIRNLLKHSVFTNGPYRGRRILSIPGGVRSFDLDYDARRIVFAWVPATGRRQTHVIATVDADGGNLRQLTDGRYNDLDPVWLPNGRIVFVSTRQEITVRCNEGNRTDQAVLHSMKSDGSDVVRLSYHETNERYPSVTNDGKLIYMRWDYIDRDFCAAHNLWECFPDGRDPRAYHGNYPLPHGSWVTSGSSRDGRCDRPFAEYFMRAIPGSHKYIALAATHHSPPWGNPILIDTSVPDDSRVSQVKTLCPSCLPWSGECGRYGRKRGIYDGAKYTPLKDHCAHLEPWPLNEDFHLISWGQIPEGEQERTRNWSQELVTRIPMKWYLIDVFGNRDLVADCDVPEGGFYLGARPLRPRSRPPIIPTATYDGERRNSRDHHRATIGIMNVRYSDFAWPEDVQIKRMRIVQLFPRKWGVGSISKIETGWSVGGITRASLGTVPVEADGSIYCEAPVNKGLMFQLLDQHGVAVQTMRSLTYVHPGEQMTCVGCHEDKWKTIDFSSAMPLAFRRPPSKLEPDVGGVAPVTFGNLVRSVFQDSCLPCHKEQGKGLLDFSYNHDEPIYPDPNGKQRLSDYVWWFDSSSNQHGLGPYGGYRSFPYRFGYTESRLSKVLQDHNHRDVVAEEDLKRIILWLDLNALELGNPTYDPEDLNAQRFGGEFRWPGEIDRSNPTGVEIDRPLPVVGATQPTWPSRQALPATTASASETPRPALRPVNQPCEEPNHATENARQLKQASRSSTSILVRHGENNTK
jgi:hypothetical protein